MENSMRKSVKKLNDGTKIKTSKVKYKASVAQTASKKAGAAPPFVHMAHNVPTTSRLREEARIQEEVQSRLTHFADNIKPKIKSQRGGSVDVLSTIRSDGHMSLSFQVKIKTELPIISYVQFSGWLAFVGPSGRSQL